VNDGDGDGDGDDQFSHNNDHGVDDIITTHATHCSHGEISKEDFMRG